MNEQPFFNSVLRKDALLREIESWRGTRFWPGAGDRASKGVGADCVSFVESVFVNLESVNPITWPPYVPRDGGEKMLDLMLETLRKVPELREVWTPKLAEWPPLIPGDIFARTVPLLNERDFHHLAIYTGDNTLYHMRERRGLCRANVRDRRAMKSLQAIFRVYESAPSNERDGSNRRTPAE